MKSCYPPHIIFVTLLLTALTLTGCPGKKNQVARDNLVRADAMIEAATITKGDTVAPQAMAKARNELIQASTYFEVDPQTGRLSNNINYNAQLSELSLTNSKNAQENARIALLAINGQATDNAPSIESNPKVVEGLQQDQINCNEKLEKSAKRLQTCQDEITLARNSTTPSAAVMAPTPSFYDALHAVLEEKIGADLRNMNASIQTGSLSVRFGEYQALFARDSSEITPETREALERFFTSFTEIIMSPEFKERVKEIRVEGYASSYYYNAKNDAERYYQNLLLSQRRASNAIGALMAHPAMLNNRWLQARLYAAGMSSNSPVLNPDGTENYEKSRRIEFRVITSE
jgi:outer membrane protein OmpA-like peptidoglycan-associated protein